MKILLAEDVDDLRELVALLIQSYFTCEIHESRDGAQALSALESNNYDLVISDYNMPKKNGGDVYTFLRKKNLQTPFILLSSDLPSQHPEFNQATFFGHIDKPFTDESIQAEINRLMKSYAMVAEAGEFVPVSITHLLNIQKINTALFIKLSDKKFVKAHAANFNFDIEEKNKYASKGVQYLFVERSHYDSFILEYKKTVISKYALSEFKPSERIEYLANDVNVVSQAASVFGWNPEVISIANINIEKVFFLSQKSSEFRDSLKALMSHSQSRLSLHSILLAMAFSGVAKELKLSDDDLLKLTSAAVLHDINLDEDYFVEKISLLKEMNDLENKNSPEMIRLREHPGDVALMIRKNSLIPFAVDKIIAQHHERPDGSGFPMGLKNEEIDLLARIFLVVEDVIYNHIRQHGKSDPSQYLISNESVYSHESFRPIYTAFLKSLT